ncbi:MAG: TonB-dependent receptor [Candidatus Scalindua sp. AMX11]|nr:MAG: TonB-dependent receptor [Candidatus Scalindua sp.]NOG84479.1 TonB-dependent receptor [Planctomycetota bacterium]RZV80512.1 MAG: TonB-dependent receptor [Candidatus Scalindua sp. SCAELEC01]TDE65271.1 MAG: TonB-dependent receptor [Candidatus Scalindua sp. AMX11]GJQ58480.1 MAG: TonB-dependent receptor [Candidatus Scalindua sp.]
MKYGFIGVCILLTVFLPHIGYSETDPSFEEKREDKKSEVDRDDVSVLETEDVQEIVVTATRTETPASQLIDSVTTITERQIEQQKARTVFETLRSVPGLSIRNSGGVGRTTSVSLRGSSADQVLVMIDGVQVNSPTTGSFDFANLTTDNLESIEVVRGPQSTLYGSDAMGGVINIITKKGSGKPQFSIRSEIGTPERTFNEAISSSGSIEDFHYSFDVARIDSNGRGSNDDYGKTNASARFGYKINDKLQFDTSLRYNDSKVNIDDGAFRQDPNNLSKNQDLVITSLLTHSIASWWSHKLKFSYTDSNLKSRDKPNSVDSDPFGNTRFRLDTQIYTGDYQHTLKYKDINTFIFGFEFEDQEADNRSVDPAIINRGWYFQNQLKLWDRLFFNAGVRVDDNNTYGKDVNPKFSIAYHLKETNTKFKANYGKGFRGPTLNELFFPNFGNPTLDPEESESYDFGFEQYLFEDRLFFGVTYFNNRYSNLIQAVDTGGFVFRAQNIGMVRTEGVEAEVLINPFEGLTMRGTFTRLHTRDELKKELIRQPSKQGSVTINYHFLDKFNLNIDNTIVGASREGRNGGGIKPPGRPVIRTNDGYFKLDVAFTYQHSRHFQLYSRIENIANQKFDEVLGFRAPGARFFLGVKLTL